MTYAGIVPQDQPAHPRKLTLELQRMLFFIIGCIYLSADGGALRSNCRDAQSDTEQHSPYIAYMSLYLLSDVSYKTSNLYTVLWEV